MKASYSSLFDLEFRISDSEIVKIDRLVIPKIQRAYAQGRKGESYIRETFLNDIFEHLVVDAPMDLNFVYGSIRHFENSYVFELVDGQQRLTTLFLLHWYIANRELEAESDEYLDICNKLSRFSYETRVSSTDFCQMLSSYRGGGLDDVSPSKVLKNSKWYFKSYDKDATVEGMLTMLDAIHAHYNDAIGLFPDKKLFDSLSKLEFHILSLGEFGLTEELYIKMNSRGLPLSAFDNFKAELTGYLRNLPVGNVPVPMTNSYNGAPVPFYVDFSTNLDTNWISLFWTIDDPYFDAKYFKFFHLYLGYKYMLEAPNITADKMQKDPNVRFFVGEDNYSERYKGFSHYKEVFDVYPDYFKKIYTVLTTMSRCYVSDILPNINPSWDNARSISGFFGKTTQNANIAFFATTEFIEAYKGRFDVNNYKKWMRVVWNIIENTETDNFTTITGVVRNLSRIIHHIANNPGLSFYEALALYGADDSSRLNSRALREEVKKAGRIADDSEWEKLFIEAESHPFAKGAIEFFYSDNISKQGFQHRIKMLNEILNENGASAPFKAEGHILLRALISQIKSWGEIWDQYLTDHVETQRHFKNWLVKTQSIHQFFKELCDCPDGAAALEKMRLATNLVSPLTDPLQKRIHSTLYKNGALQDWLQENAAIRLRSFKDNIYMLKNYSYRVMLDTDRNRFIPDIIEQHYFEYVNPAQKAFWDKTQYYFGTNVDIVKRTNEAEVLLSFDTSSTLIVKVKPLSTYRKTLILQRFGKDEESIHDGFITITDSFNYNIPAALSTIFEEFISPIEEVLNS